MREVAICQPDRLQLYGQEDKDVQSNFKGKGVRQLGLKSFNC